MSTEIVEHVFTGTTASVYDSTKTTLGSLMVQNTGSAAIDKWVGPRPTVVTQTYDTFNTSYLGKCCIIDGDNNCDWIFLTNPQIAASGGTATPPVAFWKYNRTTNQFSLQGAITLTFPYSGTVGVFSTAGFVAHRYLYTTGTVEVSGTTVTGTNTTWQSARIATGARIGFGSTSPAAITDWYEIATITNDTSITLLGTAGTISSGTPYVIEELRLCLGCFNPTTATNAGAYLVKGIHPGVFTGFNRIIPAAVSTDNIRAVYWLAETATTAMTAIFGAAKLDPVSNTDHTVYMLNAPTTTTVRIYAFNMRAALTVVSGRTTSAYLWSTGVSGTLPVALTTTMGAHKFITCNHGPGAGQPSLYLTSATRVYRIRADLIYDGSINFVAEGFREIPPGSVSTTLATGGFYSIDYAPEIDRFIIGTTTVGIHAYITKFNPNSDPMDNWWGLTFSQLDRSGTLPGFMPTPTAYLSAIRYSNGTIFYIRQSASTIPGVMYAFPLVHWDYADVNGQRVITPAMNLPRAKSLTRVFANATTFLGSDAYGNPTDPYRIKARISGISDNSGSWTAIDGSGDLSAFNSVRALDELPPTQIQFMFEFKTPYWTNNGARIHSVACVYEKYATDSHFKASGLTSPTNSVFVWKFVTGFGSSVPALQVVLFDEATDEILLNDDTNYPRGVFEKSTDGGRTWSTWDNSDRTNDQTFVRYTPYALPASKKIRMVLMQR